MRQLGVVHHSAISRARLWFSRFAAPESVRGKRIALLALLVLTGLCLVLNDAVGPAAFPVFTLVVPLVFGGLLLSPRPLLVLIAAVLAVVAPRTSASGTTSSIPAPTWF